MSADTYRESPSKERRYKKTWAFIKPSLRPGTAILDIGTKNPFADLLVENGFNVENTRGEDLDEKPESLAAYTSDVTTAFEILEHLLNPLGVLKSIIRSVYSRVFLFAFGLPKPIEIKMIAGINIFMSLKTGNLIGFLKKVAGKLCGVKNGRAQQRLTVFGQYLG